MEQLRVCNEEIELAKNEPPIKESDLLLEILPLMQEYFVGDIKSDGKSILYRMPNGQSFLITAKQA